MDALFRLAAAGVRVPKPFHFFEGVLLIALTGQYEPRVCAVDLSAVLREIEDARLDAAERDLRRGAAP